MPAVTARPLTIATRNSPLALWQAGHVQRELARLQPGLTVELLPMTTEGDRLQQGSLAKLGGKGLFVKELETALLDGRADLAVHSMKDVPMALPQGLEMAAVCERGDPYDAFVSPGYAALADLPAGARLGTSSLRRGCQLAALRPDLRMLPLRGNVGTRLGKLEAGECEAAVLAAAGLQRLGLAGRIRQRLSAGDCLPAAGQGALGVECRSGDEAVLELIGGLHHPASAARVQAERAAVAALLDGSHGADGSGAHGCQVPVAAYAEIDGGTGDGRLHLRALVGEVDGSVILRAGQDGDPGDPQRLGAAVAEELLAQGAADILARLK